MFYTRRPDILRRAFSLVPEYLRTAEDPRAVNLMDYGVPLGRRFRALKFWFVLRYFGREGIAETDPRADRVGAGAGAPGRCRPALRACRAHAVFRRLLPATRARRQRIARLLERVNATGEVFLSHTVLNGRYALRLAIGNIGTTRAHVQRAWELVKANANGPGIHSHQQFPLSV